MSKKKSRGLGKGLGALIRPPEEIDNAPPQAGLQTVPVEEIRPNPHQPRTEFDNDSLIELANSISEHGLIQPLILHEIAPHDYTLIAGERRWRASQIAGLAEVPAVIKNGVTPQEMLELAIIENVQRADLNPLEEGLAYQQLINEFGLTQANVAQRVGKGRSTITNMVRLLELPPNIQQAVNNGTISGGHARTLLPLPNAEQQTALLNSIIQNGWSVRQTEAVVRKILEREPPKKKQKKTVSAEISDLAAQFQSRLGTRVNIEHGKKGGKVVIHYYSDEELNAIYDTIIGDD